MMYSVYFKSIKKKKAFILLELLIAMSLIAMFTIPFIRSNTEAVKKQKISLIALEQERKAEELFFKLYKDLLEKRSLSSIPFGHKEKPNFFTDPLLIDLGKLGKVTRYAHYHLYSKQKNPKPFHKLFCQIIFTSKPGCLGTECTATSSISIAEYGFVIAVEQDILK